MMKLIQNKELLASMNKYMFNRTMFKGFTSTLKEKDYASPTLAMAPPTLALPAMAPPTLALPAMAPPTLALPAMASPTLALPAMTSPSLASHIKQKNAKPFVPFQKDKLFWCFYIILNGYEEYEMIRTNSFSIEKQLKIKTVEKLKSIKDQLKELKLKRTELEDELVNKQMITKKGLCALCLVHNVSVTYVYGRKYCEITPIEHAVKQGIIIQNEKKEDALKWTSNEMTTNADFLTQIRADYWLIENIQKPLNAPSAYTLGELQEIANKLQIATHAQVNEKMKAKVKTALYEEILQTI